MSLKSDGMNMASGSSSKSFRNTNNPSSFVISTAEPHEAYKILKVKGSPSSSSNISQTNAKNMESRSITFYLQLELQLQTFLQTIQRKIKRATWKWHGKLIPLLHWQDWVETRVLGFWTKAPPPPPKELFVNLRVLWNKAISSLDPSSPVYEGGHSKWWTFRLLPPTTRWFLSIIPSSLFPRWFHANIELRTAYLNRAMDQLIDSSRVKKVKPNTKIRLILLGAGYDTRSIRLLQQQRVDQVWEFDLPPVMESKRFLLKRRGLYKLPIPFYEYKEGQMVRQDDFGMANGEEASSAKLLECIGLDLNQPESFRAALEDLLKGCEENQGAENGNGESLASSNDEWYTIIVSEALFLYLEPDIPAKLLTICQDLLAPSSKGSRSESPIAFCFADRLSQIPVEQAYNVKVIQEWFEKIGWTLVDWLPKQGATRQMGISISQPKNA